LTAPRPAVGSQARAVAILCMLVSSVSGAWSFSEAFSFFEPWTRSTESLPRGTPGAEVMARFAEATLRAMRPDRQARAALLVILAISLMFTFVSAGRVLRPAGLPREGIRKLLCTSAVISAVLRTVDGAADAAFSLRLARIAAQLVPPGEPLAEWLLRPPFAVGISVFRTVLVAGALAIIAQYFRSARVKAWAALQDEARP